MVFVGSYGPSSSSWVEFAEIQNMLSSYNFFNVYIDVFIKFLSNFVVYNISDLTPSCTFQAIRLSTYLIYHQKLSLYHACHLVLTYYKFFSDFKALKLYSPIYNYNLYGLYYIEHDL